MDTAARFGAMISSVIMLSMMVMIMTEMLLRTFFAASMFITYELVGYGLANLTFLGLAYSFRVNGFVRMTLLVSYLGRGMRRVLEVFCTFSTLLLMVFLFIHFWNSVVRNYERGAVSASIAEIPLWLTQSPVLFGLLLFIGQLISYLARLILTKNPLYLEQDQTESAKLPSLSGPKRLQ